LEPGQGKAFKKSEGGGNFKAFPLEKACGVEEGAGMNLVISSPVQYS